MSTPKPATNRFGPYLIREKLGTGSVAVAYLASREDVPNPVVLKLLRPEFMSHPGLAERFEADVAAASRLRHAHLLPISSFGAPKGRLYIEVPYMPRRSLAQRFAQPSQISPQEAIRLLRHLASVLDALHRQNALYDNWKLENILLDDVGSAHLADFALPRIVGLDLSKRLQAGTAAYFVAPETPQNKLTPRADFYALGVLAYAMLVGRFPFSEASLSDLVRAHVNKAAPAPSSLNPKLPDALDAVLLRALSKNPEERYMLADTFVEAIARALPDDYKTHTTVNLWNINTAESPAPQPDSAPAKPADSAEHITAEAWFEKAQAAASDAEKIEYLKKALALEPWHTAANRQLMRLEGPKTLVTQTQTARVVTDVSAETPPDTSTADMPDMPDLVPLKKARPQRRQGGLSGRAIALGFLVLAGASSLFVLNFLGLLPSGVTQTINGTPVNDIPGIAGTPLSDIPGIALTLSPNQTKPLELGGTNGDTLSDGGLHEYTFNARLGQEMAILIQFISLNANSVSTNVGIVRPDGSNGNAACVPERVLQIEGDTGLGFTCVIDQQGEWKVRIYGVAGESTGAYFVTVGPI